MTLSGHVLEKRIWGTVTGKTSGKTNGILFGEAQGACDPGQILPGKTWNVASGEGKESIL